MFTNLYNYYHPDEYELALEQSIQETTYRVDYQEHKTRVQYINMLSTDK